jgi:hypothetical protein
MTSAWESLDGEALERLRQAAEEASYLVARGYPADAVAAFVGKHRSLGQAEQALLDWSARLDAQVKHHIARELDPEDVERRPLKIDASSTLATIDAALRKAPLLESAAGVLCDPSFRRDAGDAHEIDRAVARAGDTLKGLRPATTVWLLDEAAPITPTIEAAIGRAQKGWRFKVEVKRVTSCAGALARAGFVVSSDPTILDGCGTWFNLPARAVEQLDGVRRIRLHPG